MDRTIRDLVQQLAGTHLSDKVYLSDAIVIDVNENERTCVCQLINGKAKSIINNVRLMSCIDDGILIVPEVESTVSIALSDFTQPYITQYGGVKKITFIGGDSGGLVKVIELTEKLNNIENKVNSLLNSYNLHTHNVTAVGSPTGPNLNQVAGQLTLTERGDIENKDIQHGQV